MPRPRKEPRVILEPARKDRAAVYRIHDGPKRVSTGCGEDDYAGAQAALTEYLARKWKPPGPLPLSELLVVEVVAAYLKEHAEHSPSREWITYTARGILEWWSGKTCDKINKTSCAAYVRWRTAQPQRNKPDKLVSDQTARHELKTLQAAINWYNESDHGPLPGLPQVTLPQATEKKVWYYLTPAAVAARIRAARRNPRWHHVVRLLLIGVHTGTRPGAIFTLRWLPSPTGGWFDLDAGLMHRRGPQTKRSNKQQTVAKIPRKLLPHLRRWRDADLARGITHVIHYQGERLDELKRSWHGVRKAAGDAGRPVGHSIVEGPHIVRHTCATWLLRRRVDLNEAAAFLGMTPKTLWDTYGHFHPDFQSDAAGEAPRRKRGGNT